MSSIDDRKTKPIQATERNEACAYRVWTNTRLYEEDAWPWKCLAAFMHLQEALDFLTYCSDRGATVLFQSPTGCEIKTPPPLEPVILDDGPWGTFVGER